ncbi:MAG: hypothetical protein V8Q67_01850 [Blautia massiliensis (ex Durand et al. 2017)]
MKRKLALMLTMTLLAGSLDSGMLVSAADFSAEESVEQAVEEEPQPTEENGAEELTDAEEELPSDEAAASETEQVDDPGEDGSEMTESGVDEADISTELETEPETDPELEARNRSWKRNRKVWQKILDLRKWKKLSLRMAVKMHFLQVRIMQDLNGTDCDVFLTKKVRLRSKRSLTMTIMIRITIR